MKIGRFLLHAAAIDPRFRPEHHFARENRLAAISLVEPAALLGVRVAVARRFGAAARQARALRAQAGGRPQVHARAFRLARHLMPRQRNTKPTLIYWLYDKRDGKPFYCGKTVKTLERRLSAHRRTPHGKVGERVRECGEFVFARAVEVVRPDRNWVACERYWISELRRLYPGNCLNVADGGTGVPGYIPSAVDRAKMRAARIAYGERTSLAARMKTNAAISAGAVAAWQRRSIS